MAGDMHGRGACMAGGVCGRGVYVAGGAPTPRQILRDTVNEQTVRILLECILVLHEISPYLQHTYQSECTSYSSM